MHNAELYSNSRDLQKRDAESMLNTYFKLIKWRPKENVLDIGCGDGSVSLELLLPRLPNNFNNLTGIDVSEKMIQSALSKNSDKRINFVKLNIINECIPENLQEKFNHVFSFYCLHWIQEQRKAFENIFRMMKPGGDMLLLFLADNPIFHIYENLAKTKKWSPHMKNWEKYCSPYRLNKNPGLTVENLVNSVGLFCHMSKVERKYFTYPNFKSLKSAVMAVCPFVSSIGKDEFQGFLDDYISEVKKHPEIKISTKSDTNDEEITMPYKIITVFASKLY